MKKIIICLLFAMTAVISTVSIAQATDPNNTVKLKETETSIGIGRDYESQSENPVLLEGYNGITAYAWELEDLSRLIWLEARGESEDCQRAITETIFNRMRSESFPDTLHEVIYEDGQYEPAKGITNSETTDEIREIVEDVFQNGNTICDEDVLFFRADYYHSWSGSVAKFCIDNTYFSGSIWCK